MRLKNGTVLPYGLLSLDAYKHNSGFNKSYANYCLRLGIVKKSYPVDAKENVLKKTTEYDVVVVEQDENRAITPITYKNCIVLDSFGGVGDFFEKSLRSQSKLKNKSKGNDFNNQDGASVLLLCLNGSSERGIIIGGFQHTERKTKLTGKGPQMFGSFNGVDIQVETDGSCRLTFNGATDSEGKPLDKEQGVTTVDIEKDGTIQFKNKGVTHRLQKDGKVVLAAEDAVTITNKKDFTIASEDKDSKKKVTAKASDGKLSIDAVSLAIKASGSATMDFGSLKIGSEGEALVKAQTVNVEAGSMVKVKATNITLDGMVALGGAGGMPAVTMQTQFLGPGNLGAPVISQAIGPFSTKVTIV